MSRHRLLARRFVMRCLVILLALPGLCCGGNVVPDFRPPVVCRTPGEPHTSLFLIGDAGAPELPPADAPDPSALVDPVLIALAERVDAAIASGVVAGVLFLGDNVYFKGMPPAGHPERAHAERVLEAQIRAGGQARIFFILGNHDWNQDQEDGWVRAKAQSDFLSTRGPKVSVHPPEACPGPDVVDFADDLRIVFFDLWSAMMRLKEPDGPLGQCRPKAVPGRPGARVAEAFQESGDRRIIFAAHPPILSAGPHGGYFPWKEHLFPFRVFNRNLWIPLPVLGSIFPLSRSLGVTHVDIMNSDYGEYVRETYAAFEPGRPALIVAGHEHSLQVHVDPNGIFHAVSGAGSSSKVDYLRHDLKTELMGLAAPGFMRLDVYPNDRMRLTVIALDAGRAQRVYSTCIP